jgi:hypothetical protein
MMTIRIAATIIIVPKSRSQQLMETRQNKAPDGECEQAGVALSRLLPASNER